MFDFFMLALQTTRLRLRPADAAAVCTLHADREAMRYWSKKKNL